MNMRKVCSISTHKCSNETITIGEKQKDHDIAISREDIRIEQCHDAGV